MVQTASRLAGVTPDGQRILLNVVDHSQPLPAITVVVNWNQELQQRVPTR